MNLIDKIEYIINYDSRKNYDPDYLDKYKMYKFQILKRLEQAFEEDPENPDFNDFCDMECYLDDIKGNHNNYVFDFSKGMQETLGEGYHLSISDWMGWDCQRNEDNIDIPKYVLGSDWKKQIDIHRIQFNIEKMQREIDWTEEIIQKGPDRIALLKRTIESEKEELNKLQNETKN